MTALHWRRTYLMSRTMCSLSMSCHCHRRYVTVSDDGDLQLMCHDWRCRVSLFRTVE